MRALTEQEVTIGGVETNIVSRLRVRNLSFYQVRDGKKLALLDLAYARGDYSLVGLLQRRFSLHSVTLDSLVLNVSMDSSGAYNIPTSILGNKAKRPAARSGWRVDLNQMNVGHSSITYSNESDSGFKSGGLYNLQALLRRGREDAYLFELEGDSSRIVYGGMAFSMNQISLLGSWNESRLLQLDSLSLMVSGLPCAGSGIARTDGGEILVNADFGIRGNPSEVANLMLSYLPEEIFPISGDVDLAFHIEGNLPNPDIMSHLTFQTLEIGSVPLHHGDVTLKYTDRSLILEKANLHTFGGTVAADGQLAFDSLAEYQFSSAVSNMDVAQIWWLLYGDDSPYQGQIKGRIQASGRAETIRDSRVSADLRLRQVKYQGRPIADFTAKLQLQRGRMTLQFHQEDSEVLADVKLADDNLAGQFSAKISQVEPLVGLFNVPEVSGGLAIWGDLGGRIDSPEIEAHISAENIRYQNFPLDSLRGEVSYRNGKVFVSKLDVAGSLDSVDSLASSFHLSNLSGGIIYRGSVSGPIDNLNGELAVNLIAPGYRDVRFDDGFARMGINHQEIVLNSLQLHCDSLLISAQGDFGITSSEGTCQIDLFVVPLDYNPGSSKMEVSGGEEESPSSVSHFGTLTSKFRVRELRLEELRTSGTCNDLERLRILYPGTPDLGGSIALEVDLDSPSIDPKAEIKFLLQNPRFQEVQIDSIRGSLAFAGGLFNVDSLELFDGDSRTWIAASALLERTEEGRYRITDRSTMRGQAHGRNFDLGSVNPFLPQDMQIEGTGSYDLTWDGTRSDLHPSGSLTLTEATFQASAGVPAVRRINARMSVQDSLLSLDTLTAYVEEIPFQLRGHILASGRADLDLSVELSISNYGMLNATGYVNPDSLYLTAYTDHMDISLFQPFLPMLGQLSGTMNSELVVSGSISDPKLNGHLEVRQMSMRPPFFSKPFEQGILKADFDYDAVRLDSLFMRKENGFVFMAGNLTHTGGDLDDIDLTFRASDLNVSRPKEVILLIKSAGLHYKSQNGAYLLSGDIVLGESRFLLNFKPQSILPFAKSVDRPERALPPFLKQTRMDVRLRESDRVWIDNNVARLRLRTELGIVGTPAQPNLNGRIWAEDGYLLFLDRKFKIKQGTVDFADPSRLNPIIDLSAESTVKSYRGLETTPYKISLSLQGPLDELVVELTSDPPLEKSNIISLLAIGATREEMTTKDAEGKEPGFGGVLLERTGSLSSQKISGYISRSLGVYTGLDEVTIEGNLFNFGKSWGPRLVASKKITDRMEVTYTTNVGHFNENGIRLDYRLSKHFSLESQTDQMGNAGTDLKYGIRFR